MDYVRLNLDVISSPASAVGNSYVYCGGLCMFSIDKIVSRVILLTFIFHYFLPFGVWKVFCGVSGIPWRYQNCGNVLFTSSVVDISGECNCSCQLTVYRLLWVYVYGWKFRSAL